MTSYLFQRNANNIQEFFVVENRIIELNLIIYLTIYLTIYITRDPVKYTDPQPIEVSNYLSIYLTIYLSI